MADLYRRNLMPILLPSSMDGKGQTPQTDGQGGRSSPKPKHQLSHSLVFFEEIDRHYHVRRRVPASQGIMEFGDDRGIRTSRIGESKNAGGVWAIASQALGVYCSVHDFAGWMGVHGGTRRRRRREQKLQDVLVFKSSSSIRIPIQTGCSFLKGWCQIATQQEGFPRNLLRRFDRRDGGNPDLIRSGLNLYCASHNGRRELAEGRFFLRIFHNSMSECEFRSLILKPPVCDFWQYGGTDER